MEGEEDYQLRPETLDALLNFYKEKNAQINLEEKDIDNDEDWELSQFWYKKEIADNVISLIAKYAKKNKKTNIAIISAPSLYRAYLRNEKLFDDSIKITLFEFDKKFLSFGENFVFYDVNEPLDIDEKYHNFYDVVIADPPFLNKDIMHNASESMRFLAKKDAAIIFITGLEVTDYIMAEFKDLKLTDIDIEHNKLANPFGLFSTVELEE